MIFFKIYFWKFVWCKIIYYIIRINFLYFVK